MSTRKLDELDGSFVKCFPIVCSGKTELPMPRCIHPGDAGWDFWGFRAIVFPEMDLDVPYARRVAFNFSPFEALSNDADRVLKMRNIRYERREWLYRLEPGEHVFLGVGFVFEIPLGYYGLIAPRGSVVFDKHCRLEIASDTVPIDAGFRGEPVVVLVNHGPENFELTAHSRICQLVTVPHIMSDIVRVSGYSELSASDRGYGCNGSTGKT